MKESTPFILKLLATIDCSIIPLSDDLKYDSSQNIGAGPYKLGTHNARSISLDITKTNSSAEVINKINIMKMTAKEAVDSALRGEVDTLDGFRLDEKTKRLLVEKGWGSIVTSLTSQYFVTLNPVSVEAPDRSLIVNTISNLKFGPKEAFFSKAYGLIPDAIPGALAVVNHQTKLHARRSTPLSIQLGYLKTDPASTLLANDIKAALSPMNVRLSLTKLSTEEYFTELRNKRFKLLLRVKYLDYPDGFSILTYFKSNYVANNFFVADSDIDAAIDRAQYLLDSKARIAVYKKIQLLILAHETIAPVAFGSDNSGFWNLRKLSVPPHPLGFHSLLLSDVTVK